MKKINFHPSFLQSLYFIIISILFLLIIITPILIKDSLYLTEKLIIEEEIVEGSLLGILFFLSILILNFYKNEVDKHKEQIKKIEKEKKTSDEKLMDSFSHIGKINIQIQEIKSIYKDVNKYPETKNDLKKTFRFLGERVLGIVNTNWVLFRIINSNTLRTISEHIETRYNFSFTHPQISNKMIINKQPIISITTVTSNPQNLNIFACCILPIDKINEEQRILIQAIINEITMLFVILNSSYYIV